MADERCGGCIALVTEGGYDLQAFAASLDAVVETLSGPAAPKVCAVVCRHTPHAGARDPSRWARFALDKPSARVIIGA